MSTNILSSFLPEEHLRIYNLETLLLGITGAVMIALRDNAHHFSVVAETIVLVIFLGGLMGITRIPFPSRAFGKPIPLFAYPIISGFISGFMDSFLVLLMVGMANLEGDKKDQFKFRAYNMFGALIGGLITYFGEVYMLPLALKYGMRYWHSMTPVIPPVIVFLIFLGRLCSRLKIEVTGVKSIGGDEGSDRKSIADSGDYLEFAAAIVLLLASHNVLLCLGVLFVYSFITGQGEDLIHVMKTETEVAVMLLLVIAWFIAVPIEPMMAHFQGWLAFIPASINGVITGALYPATGVIWREVHILSTAVLLTPVSSLVGVMLFKNASDWAYYVKLSVPIMVVWFLLCGAWFYGAWPHIDEGFYSVFSRPELTATVSH
ncbi:MAG: hypothetical protein COT91_03130 [Candidatus Doudnabacteria bacterium CG10_big_fil_rev_8_21_14_0_10_41_10]|uniref:Uncharacterized protein n=1 Tax=Candidatus Doudnabacteria bacterium CG10_big_fil_rev_8_21_14_0_10_41_10 TaxID=1974551 RepID=A0A2H0VDB8_9BACT|nr:MAG: hypothetical protein COT91_03130 [Candidatus Doudnabacteria bacterium CG10_big_fil_rev_8_21_14_0_10_41_10]